MVDSEFEDLDDEILENDLKSTNAKKNEVAVISSDLAAYYRLFYPFRTLFQWLNHGYKTDIPFQNREFAFTLENNAYLRYKSYINEEDLKKDVVNLNPARFEIGGVYNIPPKERKTVAKSALKVLEKEFVLDIDLTDYDDIRTCCKDANICSKCWKFISVAIKIIDRTLREDFGFKHILWVFSGRRGIHAWISDSRARRMNDNLRKAVTSYLYYNISEVSTENSTRQPWHPMLARALEISSSYFQEIILKDQDPWRDNKKAEIIIKNMPDQSLRDKLKETWEQHPQRSSKQKWNDIDTLASKHGSSKLDSKQLVLAKQAIILHYLYPRLDAAVSVISGHLLKAPFCVHPKTGQFSVPLLTDLGRDGSDVDDFNPLEVPTLEKIINELKEIQASDEPTENLVLETSLGPYIKRFKSYVQEFIDSEHAMKRKIKEENILTF